MDNSKSNSRRRLWIIIGAFVILLCIGTVLVLVSDRQTTKETPQSADSSSHTDAAERFMRLLTRPDGAASYARMSPELKRKIGEVSVWTNQLEGTYSDSRATRFTLQEISEVDPGKTDPLRYTYTVSFRDGTTINVIIVVKSNNGSFLIDAYEVQR